MPLSYPTVVYMAALGLIRPLVTVSLSYPTTVYGGPRPDMRLSCRAS